MDHRRTGGLFEYGVLTAEVSPVGGPVRELRERLATDTLGQDGETGLAELDEILIEAVCDGDVLGAILVDDPAQPLTNWWWHLGAIRDRTFPADLLPGHLRAVCSA